VQLALLKTHQFKLMTHQFKLMTLHCLFSYE